jgi:hypothetical protein
MESVDNKIEPRKWYITNFTCCICEEKCRGYWNNPQPLKAKGKCCLKCYNSKVKMAQIAGQLSDLSKPNKK